MVTAAPFSVGRRCSTSHMSRVSRVGWLGLASHWVIAATASRRFASAAVIKASSAFAASGLSGGQ